jgi:lipoyl(octanoyl) transferase
MPAALIVRHLGQTDFAESCRAMQRFTAQRSIDSADELWLTEHAPVYSLGLNRKLVRLPSTDSIPLVHTDRGGKISYHGPGQLVIYVLLDLKRRQLNIRSLVTLLETTVVDLLASYGVQAFAKADAPGVYVDGADGQLAKVAALGLRIKNNCCYHGLSLNVDMDLSPFLGIDPCGYAGLNVTQTKDLGVTADSATIAELLLSALATNLNNGYSPTESA